MAWSNPRPGRRRRLPFSASRPHRPGRARSLAPRAQRWETPLSVAKGDRRAISSAGRRVGRDLGGHLSE